MAPAGAESGSAFCWNSCDPETMPASLLLFVLAGLPLQQAASPPAPPGDGIKQWVSEHLDGLDGLYRDLHAHPELSLHEEKTAARLSGVLEKAGFQVSEKIGGTGVVGILMNGPGPVVLVRTEMDALPVIEETGLPFASTVQALDDRGRKVGVMHACGHDVHMTVWSGTASFLGQHKELWKGTVVFIAQPAEEIGAGARQMIDGGLFTFFPKPDFTLALHVDSELPAGVIGYTPGYCYANVDSVDILVRGRGGHGSAPQTTHDPVALAARIVMGLQTIVSREVDPLDKAVVTVGSIHGGTKHNIIPNEVKLQLTVRSYTDKVRRQLLDGIRRVARGEALAAGFPEELLPVVTVLDEEFTPAAYNDPGLVARVNPAIARELGAENVVEVPPSMGGEDFGRYAASAKVPGYMFRLGSIDRVRWEAAQQPGAEPLPSLHTSHYAPLLEASVRTGATAMAAALLELLGS